MRLVVPLLLVACTGSSANDTVKLAYRVADTTIQGHAVTWDQGTIDVRAVRSRPCPSEPVVLDWPGPVPAEALTLPSRSHPQPWTVGYDVPLAIDAVRRTRLPVGPWCSLDLVARGTLALSGTVEGGGAIALTVDLPSLATEVLDPFGGGVLVTPDAGGRPEVVVHDLVALLGADGWLDALLHVPTVGATTTIAPTDPEAAAIVEALSTGSSLVEDLDDNGFAGPAEVLDATLGAFHVEPDGR